MAVLIQAFVFVAEGNSAVHPSYSQVSPGVFYAHVTTTNEPWSIHVLRYERSAKSLQLICTLAQEHIVGLRTVAEQVRQIPADCGLPIAAVNGDFFVIKPGPYQGDPDGLQIEAGELVSAPNEASLWLEQGTPHIDNIRPMFRLQWPDGTATTFGLNEAPRSNSIVLFTPRFGPSTRATNELEFVLEPVSAGSDWLPLRASGKYRARVLAVNTNGNSELRPGQMVLSFGQQLRGQAIPASAGSVLTLSTECSRNLRRTEWAIAGRHVLVHNSKEGSWPEELKKPAAAFRNPRTAAGYNSRSVFLVEVDGRQKQLSVGMTFTELARLMKQLGCTDALNLDGGGSSTFWLKGKIKNSPSDKHERAVANALVLVQAPSAARP